MIDGLRGWAFGLCAAAVACALAQMVLPKSSMQRVFQVTCSVFFLCCLLSPVALTPFAADFSVGREEVQRQVEERSQRLGQVVEGQQKQLAAESVRREAAKALEELGVKGGKIYINVHDGGTDSISISECEVVLDTGYEPRHQEIRAALKERLGVNVVIGYQKE